MKQEPDPYPARHGTSVDRKKSHDPHAGKGTLMADVRPKYQNQNSKIAYMYVKNTQNRTRENAQQMPVKHRLETSN
jgi:hypothetical protein